MTAPYDWTSQAGPTYGSVLHRNGLYVGRLTAFYAGEVISVAVGTARAALDEFERIVTTKKTTKAPRVLRYQTAEVQRIFGLALTMVDAAESLLNDVGNLYTEHARAWYDDAVPFTWKMDTRLRGRVHQAGRLAADAVDLLFQNAGSSAAMYGQRMQRYYRDISVFKGHPTGTVDTAAVVHAQTYFGLNAPTAEVLG
jgi:3-hydroxy-9,10-secoandrosta-1,3,5(10)-triene-9,17-dione monooxygenase